MNINEYKKMPQSLSFVEMRDIHEDILSAMGRDETARELYNELLEASLEYANMRSMWYLMDADKRAEQDRLRTSYHDSVITHINMLYRYLKKNEKNVEWRDVLGYEEENVYNRKRIGDFGCYLSFVTALLAR